ncbi:MAG: S41 family peptidase [Spirosomataceae bacterium]
MKKLLLALLMFAGVCANVYAQETPLWMRYPAISPDGKTIVFSYKGDLYRVPTAGGPAIPLTLHEAQDWMPVWSHDGKSIAFASDRYGNFDVFVMPATGGEAKRLTYHSSADFPSDFSADNQRVIFSSVRLMPASDQKFPGAGLGELYSVPVGGGQTKTVFSTPAEMATYSSTGNKIIFQDNKGYEDDWRKHHTSSITRDIWVYDVPTQKFTQLTTATVEDRNPIFAGNDNDFYYLSEQKGSFNIFKSSLSNPSQSTAITSLQKHPVRFLTRANDGTLCYSFHGEIYTLREGQQPKKVEVQIFTDGHLNTEKIVPIASGASEMAVSPNGKEIALVVRGEIFVTSVEGGITKRITNTPEQERSVSFSPDGRTLLYAGERNNNWNVYKTVITRAEEPYFYASTVLKEEPVVATEAEEFQPEFSPDGKKIAYLEERTVLKVLDVATKQIVTALPSKWNYSYSDGDQHYAWSPDSKWLLVDFSPENQYFLSDMGLVSADGKGELINLTQSGYNEGGGKWAMNGKVALYTSDRDGMKNHGSWGGEGDVYGMFFSQEAFDRFKLSKEDLALLKEKEDKEKKDKEEKEKKEKEEASKLAATTPSKDKKEVKKEPTTPAATPSLELDDIDNRKIRLTIHSSRLSDAVLSPDGEKLYYLARFEKGNDLWVTETRTKDTKILVKDAGFAMEMTKDGKALFVVGPTGVSKIETESGKRTPVTINGEMNLNYVAEKSYIFDHAWRQVVKKFYVTNLHGVDWKFYYDEYKRFVPHINNNHDFAEMLSELLGELNASHTGCRYSPQGGVTDATASLGLFYDESYTGNGLKIAEVMERGPLHIAKSKVKAGHIIEKIDGEDITADKDFNALLNRKAGKNTLLSLFDPTTNTRWEETLKPISRGEESQLLYRRWVEARRKEVDKLSNGTVGYVHVRGMNDASYRTTVEEVLGKNANKESLIVDTRFNGGGWLHDDLATFLNGKKYIDIVPRGEKRGYEPFKKWIKPSVVLVGESNYSDAHMFPFAYRANEIGKIVGMPIPGTGTAVWWEQQIDPTLVFGIPQVGMVGTDGKYLENTQLEPDVKVKNEPEVLSKGRDQQIERAVQELKKSSTKPVGLGSSN